MNLSGAMDSLAEDAEEQRSPFEFGSKHCSLEELRDYLNHIRDVCAKNTANPAIRLHQDMPIVFGFYSSGNSADYIIMLCDHWQLLNETKYKALEIFNRFMSALISQLHDMIYTKTRAKIQTHKSSSSTEDGHITSDLEAGIALNAEDIAKHSGWVTDDDGDEGYSHADKEWKETCEHIITQMPLRAITAIIIASKVTAHEHIVSLNKAVDMLVKQGQCYSKSVLVKSELRVLNTINYDVRLLNSPYPCMMVLLDILCRIDNNFNGSKIYEICVHLLNLFYYHRPRVVSYWCKIHVTSSGLPRIDGEKQEKLYLNMRHDVLKISGVLVCTAVYILNKELSDLAILNLSEIVESDEKSLLHDCCVVLQALLEE